MLTRQAFIFNATLPSLGSKFAQPDSGDFPVTQFKCADINYVRQNTTDYVREILDAAPIKNQHKHVVVDVKVTLIKKNKPPCLPGWHCDTVINPFEDSLPENHHLFVSGNASRTEFIGTPVELNVPFDLKHQSLLKNFREQLEQLNFYVYKIPSCQFASYGRFHFHRGSLGLYDEKRLLIRVSETNVITPRNTPFQEVKSLS